MSTTKIEFAVQMTCDSCVQAVKKSLEGVDGVEKVDVNLSTGTVVVDTTLATEDVQKRLQSSGRKAIVKGYAGSLAGVAVLEAGSNKIQGVVRFVQISPDTCIVDGTIDGLQPGNHKISVHECGDISKGCECVGSCYNPRTLENGRVYGHLTDITATNDRRATFRLEDNVIQLHEIIGRSLVVSEHSSNDEKKLVCGIIARSAGLFQNPKTICACDGVSLWDERSKSKASL